MNSVSVKELHQLHSNIFNTKEVSCKCVLKMNKDVHNDTINIYILSVIKSEKQQISNMNCHMLMKSVLTDHLDHNIEKNNTEKKNRHLSSKLNSRKQLYI